MEQTPLEGLMSISGVHGTACLDAGRQKPPRPGRLRQPRSWSALQVHKNAARERSRVRNLRQAFHSLQAALPSVPPDTKLSKLDVLLLATNYITQLSDTLQRGGASQPSLPLHPVKKWPMRSLLYCSNVGELLSANQKTAQSQEVTRPPSPKFENIRE
ncbi:unnamed protein product [Gadus morhua 'NCC']